MKETASGRGRDSPPRDESCSAPRLAAPAAQTSSLSAVLTVAAAWTYVGSFTLPLPAAIAIGALLPVLAFVGFLLRTPQPAHLALFCSLVALGSLLLPVGVSMPGLAAGTLIYLLMTRFVPPLKGAASWLRVGTLTPHIGWLMALSVVISAAGLVGWVWVLQPDVSEFLLFPPGIPGWVLPWVVLGFSMLNAAAEEAVFRGAVMEGLDEAFGPGWLSIVMQAAVFGVWHIHGFPKGVLGSAMAFVFGLMLGVIRRRSRGLLAVWITHIFADIVVLGILLQLT